MKRLILAISILSKKKIYKIYRGSVYRLETGKKYRFGLTARTTTGTTYTSYLQTTSTQTFVHYFCKTRQILKV